MSKHRIRKKFISNLIILTMLFSLLGGLFPITAYADTQYDVWVTLAVAPDTVPSPSGASVTLSGRLSTGPDGTGSGIDDTYVSFLYRVPGQPDYTFIGNEYDISNGYYSHVWNLPSDLQDNIYTIYATIESSDSMFIQQNTPTVQLTVGTIWTITASAGSHGTISPSGEVSVGDGTDKTFTITPDEDYVVDDVLVDDASVGAVTTYTFNSVTANHTIAASFTADLTPPSAPTNPVTDDDNDTFGWTNVPGFDNASDYEYTKNGGTSWNTCTAKPQTGFAGNIAADQVRVRVKASQSTGRPAGAALQASTGFTVGLAAYIASTAPTSLTEAAANDGSLTSGTVVITIANGTLAADIAKANVTAANLPAGLDYTVTRTDDTHLTINITGNATNHANANDVSNLAFIIAQAKVSGANGDLTTEYISIDFNDPAGSAASIASTVPTSLTEAAANDGSLTSGTIVITIANGTLAADIAKANVTAANLLAGLDYTVTRTDDTHLTINITGNATNHANANDVSNLTFTIAQAKVTGATGDLTTENISIDFNDPAGSDTTAPTVVDGTISTSGLTYNGVTLNWNKATDDVSAQGALQYLVYRSDSNNIDTVENIEANGTAIGSYAADINTRLITGLTAGTTYYFNVIVKDEAGNKTAYTMKEVTTSAAPAPSMNVRAGVTIIIHGWNIDGTEPLWTASMQDAIIQNSLGGEGQACKITVTGTKGNLSVVGDPWDVGLAESANGQVVVRVDWSAVANNLTSGVTAQEVAAAIAPYIYQGQNGQPPLSELPIHLIGHSRGGGMAYDLAGLLGAQGIEVEQLTTLDPHPLTASDPQGLNPPLGPGSTIDTPISGVPENVLFADNYWQSISYPKGQAVAGAYNREFTSLPGGYHNSGSAYSSASDHLNIVLLYQGTIDTGDTVNNGEATMGSTERSNWFNAYEDNGAKTGFYYSGIGGGDRKSTDTPVSGGDQVIDGYSNDAFLGGAGSRQALTWTNAVWPNVITLDILRDGQSIGAGTQTVTPGEALDLKYIYRDYDSDCDITVYADRDRNPYNDNNLAAIATQSHTATGSDVTQATAVWNVTSLSPAENYYVYARITDGAYTRYLYAVQEIEESTAPAAGIASTEPTSLSEAAANDGSLDPNTVVITIANGTLADPLVKEDVTAANLPAGLDYTVTRDSDTQLTITISGNAANHADADDVSDLTFTIAQAKVTGAVSDLTTENISIDFNDPDAPAAPTNPVVDDANNTFGWTNTPGFNNVPDYEYTKNGGTNWTTCTVNPQPGFTGDIAADQVRVRVKADPSTGRPAGAELQASADFTSNPAAGIASTVPTSLTEAAANDGSLASGTVVITIANGTLADPLVKEDVTAANLPAGLDYTVTRDSDTQLTITISGNANNHAYTDDVNNLTLTIAQSKVTGAVSDLTTENISIDFNDPAATAPDIAATPEPVPFGDVLVGSTTDQVVTVKNEGDANLTIGQITNPAAPFSIIADNVSNQTLAPGAEATLTVRFAPAAAGPYSSSFNIPSDDPDENPVTVNLSGNGIAPDITVTPLPVPFGDVLAGSTADQVVTIKNEGDADLIVGQVTAPGAPFSIIADNVSNQTLAPGASTTLTVRFAPPAAGPYNDSFNIPSDDPDENPVTVNLSGNGVIAPDLTGSFTVLRAYAQGRAVMAKVLVQNIGNAPSGSFKIAFYLSGDASFDPGTDQFLWSRNVLGIGAGKDRTTGFFYKFRNSVSGKYLLAVIDSTSQVAEFNENNNTAAGQIP